MTAENTKIQLLEAAREEFSLHGLAGARVDRVAKAAGVNVQRIYAYFGDKRGLFEEVIKSATLDLGRALGTEHSSPEQYAEVLFDFLATVPLDSRIVAWARLERGDQFFMEMVDSKSAWEYPISLLQDLKDRGKIDQRWDARATLTALIGLCEGLQPMGEGDSVQAISARKELVLHFARSLGPA